MARERHQHLERAQVEFTDQHGRAWLAETEPGMDQSRRPRICPVGQFHPRFKAPVIPDQKYLVYDPRKPSLVSINYRAMLADIDESHERERQQIENFAWAIYKDEAPRYIKDPSPEILSIVRGKSLGPEPREIPIALAQGNPYLLGLTTTVDERVVPFLERWYLVKKVGRRVDPFAAELDEGLDFRPLDEIAAERRKGKKQEAAVS